MPDIEIPSLRKKKVLAVDPGATTGLAICYPERLGWEQPETDQLNFENFVIYIMGRRTQLRAIVVESYTITQETMRKSRQNWSLELIGFLRATALLEGIPFVIQSPGDAKRFGTDEKLAKAGWLVTPKTINRHANDALRHLMLYCVKNKLMEVPR